MPYFALILLWVFLLSCQQQDAYSPDLARAYAELRVVSEQYGRTSPESGVERAKVLQKYHFSDSSFAAEVKLLRNEPELWMAFQQGVVAYLDSLYEKSTPSGSKASSKKEASKKRAEAPKKASKSSKAKNERKSKATKKPIKRKVPKKASEKGEE
jgi:hypothetical protein